MSLDSNPAPGNPSNGHPSSTDSPPPLASPPPSPQTHPKPGPAGFFVTGGTLPLSSRSYIERAADRELLQSLRSGEFCYVLTARQMGKSSLMVRTAGRLREQGVAVAVIDLTAIGQNVSPDQWYDGLAQRLGRQLRLEDAFDDFWLDHSQLGPCQRLFTAIRDIALEKIKPPPLAAAAPTPSKPRLVIFVDEIDAVRSLKFSTDEFFAAIRECYNRRPVDPDFERLTFCLLGVATPADLIQDPRTTPFNIGRRILLTDFSPSEAAGLVEGLMLGDDGIQDMDRPEALAVLSRILHWTGGQPFLTQRFCRAVAHQNDATSNPRLKIRSPAGIDQLCREMFFAHRSRETDDHLHIVRDRLLRADVSDRVGMLEIYRRVLSGRKVADDETNPLINTLRLSGVVRAVQGQLVLRNRIFGEVFNKQWIDANLPEAEKVRQKLAFRRGVILTSITVCLLALFTAIGFQQTKQVRTERVLKNISKTHADLQTYQDRCEIIQELVTKGDRRIRFTTVLQTAIQRPDKLNIEISKFSDAQPSKLQFVRNGNRIWIFSPDIRAYQILEATNSLDSSVALALTGLPEAVQQAVYPLITSTNPLHTLQDHVRDIEFAGEEGARRLQKLTGRMPVRAPRISTNGLVARVRELTVPISAYIRKDDSFFDRLELDLTEIEKPLIPGRDRSSAPPKNYTVRIQHENIVKNERLDPSSFLFEPPTGAAELRNTSSTTNLLDLFAVPNDHPFALRFRPNRRTDVFPRRSPDTPPHLIDLSPHFTAHLDRPWHLLVPGNDLAQLRPGIHSILGIDFDVRGIVKASPPPSAQDPRRTPDSDSVFRIDRFAKSLHFLHGANGVVPDGTLIGHYLVRYADGESRLVPILYGFDVRDWTSSSRTEEPRTGLRVAWEGSNRLAPRIRIFLTSWANPRPNSEIALVEFRNANSPSTPFLLAITADP